MQLLHDFACGYKLITLQGPPVLAGFFIAMQLHVNLPIKRAGEAGIALRAGPCTCMPEAAQAARSRTQCAWVNQKGCGRESGAAWHRERYARGGPGGDF